MQPLASWLVLPPALLAFLCQAADSRHNAHPTALRKLSPDSSEKIFPEHLAFAPVDSLLIDSHALVAEEAGSNGYADYYRRAFGAHLDDSPESIFRRAAQALAVLERRSSCPGGMSSCADQGAPNKCCQEGTYCTRVSDEDVGNIACCPEGSTCGGMIGNCPSDSAECPASLGGGCCIPGYVCQGFGCITSTSVTITSTEVVTSTQAEPTTETTESSTSSESEEETTTESEDETTTRTTRTSETATGEPPWRPTVTSEVSTEEPDEGETQTGCPTGFYGCLATHGGGCCRTDRDCETHSCPAPSSTTIVSNGVTVVVDASDVPASVTATCADGWFMCGDSGGPVAGCCPSGYDCGTASCFTVQASETQEVQKELPDEGAASVPYPRMLAVLISVLAMVGATLF